MMQRLIRPLRRALEHLIPFVIVLVIGLLLAHSWEVNHVSSDERDAEEANAEIQNLGAVVNISFLNGTETLLLHLGEDEVWYWMDETFPLEQETVAGFAAYLASFEPETVAASGKELDLESYDLSSPLYSLSFTTAGGETRRFDFGKSDETGTFMKSADEDTVIYYAPQELLAIVQTRLYQLCVLPSFPTLDEDHVTALTIRGSEREVNFLRYVNETTAEVTWRQGASDVTQEQSFHTLMDSLQTLSFSECLVWNPVEDSLALCGLTEPQLQLIAQYTDASGRENTLTLFVGNRRNETQYFVTYSEQQAIYAMDSTALEELFLRVSAN